MTSEIFVYGTLRRGQCREHCWPRPPVRITPAFVRGQLFDLGPYPAMLAGNDWVRGELWTIRSEDLPETLKVLDAIEGYAQAGEPDLYLREKVDVFGSDGVAREPSPTAVASTYFLVAERLPTFARRIQPRIHSDDAHGSAASGAAGGAGAPDRLVVPFAYAYWPDDGRTVEETSSLADPFDPVP